MCNVYYIPFVAIRKLRRLILYAGPLLLTAWVEPAAAAVPAAIPPYVQLTATVGAPLAPGSCGSEGPTPVLRANLDLGADGSYRYSPAFVVPYYFDDEGEFNLVYNQDATLFVSQYVRVAGVRTGEVLPLAPLAQWFTGFGSLPANTELAVRVAAYDESGRAVSISRISWDCTTGVVKSLDQRGNALGAAPLTSRLVEFYHAELDHYFMSADAAEIALLDAGTLTGWQRTGQDTGVFVAPQAGAQAVCRFYLPPGDGDSHFFSASPAECADVAARFPRFALESAAVFYVALPDASAGTCPADTVPTYRLWNQRTDSNHRYTRDPAIKAQMIARGYVAEGYGADAVAMCTLP